MMKAAFAHWKNRIAPVFDTARQIQLVEVESGRIVGQTQDILPDSPPVQKALRLAELGVSTLVCGAISRPLQELVAAYGIQVIAFVAGEVREVIQVWRAPHSDWGHFAMPGCGPRGRNRFRGLDAIYRWGNSMNGQGRDGMRPGGGRGHQGRGGQRAGRMGGPRAAMLSGDCVCPQCGQREPHQRGVRCVARKCPQCGAAMTRS